MALSPVALAVAYLGIGAIGAAVVLHRAHRRGQTTAGEATRPAESAASAAAMVLLWPLWAPFALAPPAAPRDDHPLLRRIAEALRADGAFEPEERARIEREVTRATVRLLEVERLLERERRRPSDARQMPASLHGAARRRLENARARDRRNLEALAELVELLGAELVLARHGSGADADELVTALWTRVEMLHDLGVE